VVAVSGCAAEKVSAPAVLPPGYLVTTEELAAQAGRPGVVIVDARSEADYKKFHFPGAVNIPKAQFRDPKVLKEILEYKKKEGFFIPPEMAEVLFSDAGIGANTRVVVYDSIAFPDASIIWALLKNYGHDNVQVLKGGFEKWVSEGRTVTSEQPKVVEAVQVVEGGVKKWAPKGRKPADLTKSFIARPRPELTASREWILKNKETIRLLDMRSFEEYVGVNPAGNPRGGHPPGTISMEWLQLAGNETVKSPEEMQKILDEAGVAKDKTIVTYCNIGFGRSTYGLFVLKMLGYDVRVYGGSFEDWSGAAGLQVATAEIGSFKDWSAANVSP
jgi:thiosulfate/3-mercaptopyruvate sulfurtransferase